MLARATASRPARKSTITYLLGGYTDLTRGRTTEDPTSEGQIPDFSLDVLLAIANARPESVRSAGDTADPEAASTRIGPTRKATGKMTWLPKGNGIEEEPEQRSDAGPSHPKDAHAGRYGTGTARRLPRATGIEQIDTGRRRSSRRASAEASKRLADLEWVESDDSEGDSELGWLGTDDSEAERETYKPASGSVKRQREASAAQEGARGTTDDTGYGAPSSGADAGPRLRSLRIAQPCDVIYVEDRNHFMVWPAVVRIEKTPPRGRGGVY